MKPLSAFLLRLLALFTMLIDHAGLALFPGIPLLRAVGRMSFVLYCFLLAEGYRHTRSRRHYFKRLLFLALISEIPFDLLLFAVPSSLLEQNVLFTLALALCALWVVDRYAASPLLSCALVFILCLTAMLSRVSYAWLGILLCLAFRVYHDRPLARAVALLLLEALYSCSLLSAGETPAWALMNLCSLLALAPLSLYNGKPGPRGLRCLFYAAYPLSLLALYALRLLRIVPPYWGIS
jgi:hypothetical protein